MKNSTLDKALPTPIEGPGTLYLRFYERRGALVKTAAALEEGGFTLRCDQDVLIISLFESNVTPLVQLLSDALSPSEQEAIKAIWEVQELPLSLRDCFDVESLRSFLARAQSSWFLEMLRENRFETHFQPIISVSQPDQVFAFEGLLRGQLDGRIVSPDTLFNVARGLDLSRELDDAARFLAIASAAKHRLNSKIFLNVSPQTLGDGRETLHTTIEAVKEAGLTREQIVFEIIESDCIDDVPVLKSALDGLRHAGFRIALDDLGAGYASLQLLSQLRPDFVKLDRELVSGVDKDPFKALIAQKLLETARALRITTVAEGVECREEWEWLRNHGGDFAQGFYFARPASPPPIMSSRGTFWMAHSARAS